MEKSVLLGLRACLGLAIIIWCYSCQTNKVLPSLLNMRLPVWQARISLGFLFFFPVHNTAASFLFTCSPSSETNAHVGYLADFSEVSYFTYLSLLAFLRNVPDAPLPSYRTSVLLTSDIVDIWQLCSLAPKFSVFSWPSHMTLACGLCIWYCCL